MKAKAFLYVCFKIFFSAMCSVILFLPNTAYAAEVDVSGDWEGAYFTSQVPRKVNRVYFTLTQSSDGSVKGFYRASTGVRGPGKGKIIKGMTGEGHMVGNDEMEMHWTNSTEQCPGKYDGKYKVSSTSMSWNFIGEDCLGEEEEGSGIAVKTAPALY